MAQVIGKVADIEPGKRMNDAKADPLGRLFCGVMPVKEGAAVFVHTADARLYRHEKGQTNGQLVIDELGIPNGLTWDSKKKKFYYVDSLAFDIREYDYEEKTGNICKFISFFYFFFTAFSKL